VKLFATILLGNTLRAWALALGLGAFTLFLLRLLQHLALNRLASFVKTTATKLDDLVLAMLERTRFFSVLAVALYAGGRTLTATPAADRYLRLGLVLALLIQGALWANAAITFVLGEAVARRKADDAGSVTALTAMSLVAKLILWTLVLLLALGNLGVNVTGLLAGLGVGGIAVALAVQNVLGDLFASLAIVLDKPFAVGDFITVGDCVGTVEHIGMKTTRVHSLSGEQIIFSNSDLLKSRIRNHKRMEERRVLCVVGLSQQTLHAQLVRIPAMMQEIIQAQTGARFDRAHFQAIADQAFVFEMVYYLPDPDYRLYVDTQQAINLELVRRFEGDGIRWAPPMQTPTTHPFQ
jgi:small-conductance mechanosensitive channel